MYKSQSLGVFFCISAACEPGYFGLNCSLNCPTNTFGESCGGVCPPLCFEKDCHHVSGCLRNNTELTPKTNSGKRFFCTPENRVTMICGL